MVAKFGGITVSGRYDFRDPTFSTFYIETPAHAAGIVDLVVTNLDGQSHRLPPGFTYAPQESFDLTGSWGGFTLNGEDTWVEFEIRENKLVSASCGYDLTTPLTFPTLPTIENGAFSFTADGGATISGRIVSTSEILGTISFPQCRPGIMQWRATPRTN